MEELLKEVIEMKENHSFLYDRSVLVFVPPIMYARYLPKTTNPKADIEVLPARLAAGGGPHVNMMVIINKKDISPTVLKELLMIPATVNGKKPIIEYVEIE